MASFLLPRRNGCFSVRPRCRQAYVRVGIYRGDRTGSNERVLSPWVSAGLNEWISIRSPSVPRNFNKPIRIMDWHARAARYDFGWVSARSLVSKVQRIVWSPRFVSFGIRTRGTSQSSKWVAVSDAGCVDACKSHTRGRRPMFIGRRRIVTRSKDPCKVRHEKKCPIGSRSVTADWLRSSWNGTMIGCRDFGQGSRKLWSAEYGLRSQYDEERPGGWMGWWTRDEAFWRRNSPG